MNSETSRGFITVATGRELYYKMAHNLLLSYRYHAKTPVPFAILCDRQSEWTADFDQVIIMDNPAFSYFDKMRILDLSPFDETIFIDADSLIYRDLNPLWDLFKDGPDVGVLGTILPLDDGIGWWDIQNLGELGGRVDYKIMCQGGIYYVRNSGKDLPAFIETCRFIEKHYLEYHFRLFEDSFSDEMIISLASCVHHFKPMKDWVDVFAFYPDVRLVDQDILSGTLVFDWHRYVDRLYRDSFLIHFGTINVLNRWEYKKEVFKLKRGGISLSNFGEFCLLWLSHRQKKVLKTIKEKVFNNEYSLEIYH